nr:hypothetical protein CFP56_67600 [Quercus suber]
MEFTRRSRLKRLKPRSRWCGPRNDPDARQNRSYHAMLGILLYSLRQCVHLQFNILVVPRANDAMLPSGPLWKCNGVTLRLDLILMMTTRRMQRLPVTTTASTPAYSMHSALPSRVTTRKAKDPVTAEVLRKSLTSCAIAVTINFLRLHNCQHKRRSTSQPTSRSIRLRHASRLPDAEHPMNMMIICDATRESILQLRSLSALARSNLNHNVTLIVFRGAWMANHGADDDDAASFDGYASVCTKSQTHRLRVQRPEFTPRL